MTSSCMKNIHDFALYFPPPVKAVSIPKKSGGERVLGIPTISDRIAQMVLKEQSNV
ncbi:MAG: hypothetical protein HAW67_08310 [Endozoicomonadaceae bacterium]|nr:hypothetical protein [Endozoicomonadaceae bacterium]